MARNVVVRAKAVVVADAGEDRVAGGIAVPIADVAAVEIEENQLSSRPGGGLGEQRHEIPVECSAQVGVLVAGADEGGKL